MQAAEGFAIPCSAIPPDSDSVLELLPPLLEGGAVVVVDGPAGPSDATRAVMLLADVVLTPVQPAGADLRTAVEVLRLIAQARRIRGGPPDAAVFLNRATKGTRLLSEAREVLAGLEDFWALGQAITQRQALSVSFIVAIVAHGITRL